MVYDKNDSYTLYLGKMQEELLNIAENSIDSIVTDPPYELNFMGKGWDNSGVAFQADTWLRCYKVLKPGGYLLAFGGTRTFHRIACAIEDAGFEIRDTIMWLYGSGFPKSMNIGLAIDKANGVDNTTGNIVKGVASNNTIAMKNGLSESQEFASEYAERKATNQWSGWGTCLKPAYEPIIVARKPVSGTVVDNIKEYGVGGINIDECRIPLEDDYAIKTTNRHTRIEDGVGDFGLDNTKNNIASADPNGRFPSNVIFTYDETDMDEVCGGMPNTSGGTRHNTFERKSVTTSYGMQTNTRNEFSDSGSAARYFYCAKASLKDRDEGLYKFTSQVGGGMSGTRDQSLLTGSGNVRNNLRKNIHPTVKPTELMQYLVRMVAPSGATILDPFMGSGSTGKAVMFENLENDKHYKFIGIEMTEQYIPIAKARIDFAINYVPLKVTNVKSISSKKLNSRLF